MRRVSRSDWFGRHWSSRSILCLGEWSPNIELSNFRELIHGAYRIIYEIRQDSCYIEAVIHSSRDLMMHYEPGKWDVTE